MTIPVAGASTSGEIARWLTACREIAAVLSASRGLESSAPELLRTLATTLGWQAATFWLPVPGSEALRAAATSGVEVGVRGESALHLAQRACATRGPTTPDDLDPRAAAEFQSMLAAWGMRGALAIPFVHGTLVHGALELVRREPFVADEASRRAADLLGGLIGQFASREETMTALHRTKRELAEVFEEAPVGILVMDAERRVLRVNRTGLAVLKTTRGALAGRPWAELFENRADADRLWGRVESTRSSGEVVTEDAQARAGDGLMWVRISLNAGWAEDGRLLRVRAFFRDIGTKVEAEASRKRSEERYLRLVTAARDYALHALDERGTVTSWNVGAERLYGWSEEAILGRDFAASFTPEDRDEDVPQRMLRLAIDEGEFHHEGWRVRQDGSRFWALVVYTAIRDASGKLLEISQLTRDATRDRRLDAFRRKSEDLARANREVLRAGRRKEELVGNVLGALRGPLLDVKNAADGLAESAGAEAPPPPVAALLARLEALNRAVAAIEDLLAPGAPDLELRPEPLDLARLSTEAREILRTTAAERQIRVDVDVEAPAVEVTADRQMVRLILHNLLSNAIKFSRERSRVRVRAVAEGQDRVRIEVEDAGIGLTEEEAARMRGPAPVVGDEATPGLGLLATRRIVDQMGGRFGVQSTPGRGSVFFVVLPRAPLPASPERRDRAPATRLAGPVLVVSEDPGTRASLCWTLGSVGLEVVAAARAEEAIDACRDRRFEAVALDLTLGGMGAVDLVTTLRAEGASRDVSWIIPCIGTRETGAAGLPVADLLPRPVPADRLFAALERVRVARSRGAEILLVEGDPDLCRSVARTLQLLTYQVRQEVDGNAALK
ncbi:MAG TPA: PAS domain S-box protein, partial [Planctomycetota bacterium]|nr:PAS domain S-box protein [Planctomycetota bacterium]